jgi:cytochrome P450
MGPIRPSHVPNDLVRDFDFYSIMPENGDIHLGWKRWQERSPDIFWTPHHGGHWVVTRGEDIETVMRDFARFSSSDATIPKEGKPFRIPMLEYDPPDQAAFRNLLQPVFAPQAVAKLEHFARALTVSLIEEFKPRGTCEFVADFAQHMPIGIFLSLAGLPAQDRAYLLPWADLATRDSDPKKQLAGFTKIAEYVDARLRERRGHEGDGLVALIANGSIDGRPISHEEAVGLCSLILFAGLDTVVASLGFFIRHLALHPGHRQRIMADRALIPKAIEEILRRHGVVQMARTVRADMDYKGIAMKAGEMVLAATPWYGLDERKFERPLEVDFDRPNAMHLAFGTGAHRCIGSMLARMELRILMEEWLPRIGDFSIEPGATVQVRSGKVNAISHLPLVW